MATSLRELLASTPLSGGNAPYVEALYEQFLADPQSVEPAWRDYFQHLAGRFETAGRRCRRTDSLDRPGGHREARQRAAHGRRKSRRPEHGRRGQAGRGLAPGADLRQPRPSHRQARSARLQKRERPRVLELGYFGLTDADLDTEFLTGSRPNELSRSSSCARLIAQLEYAYCGTIGAEFAHVSNTEERLWLQDQFLRAAHGQANYRRAEEHPLAALGGRGPRALPAHEVRRPEALLARRRRLADPAAWTT
jgi:2-oxoglutarate dehydrogenase E1 component